MIKQATPNGGLIAYGEFRANGEVTTNEDSTANGELVPKYVSRQLALLEQARIALDEANTIDQSKDVRDKVEVIRQYMKSIGVGLRTLNSAAAMKLRAQRKVGSFLRLSLRHGGNRKSRSLERILILADLKINPNQSVQWRAEAAIPDEDFERYLVETNAAEEEVSSAGLRRYATKLAKKGRRRSRTDKVSGSFLKLAENENDVTANVGGVVAVMIRDSASRPPKDIKVVYGRQYKKLGVVHGSQNDEGEFLAGGGYTMWLLKPMRKGEGTITVSYTENDDAATTVERRHNVTVEPNRLEPTKLREL